MNSYLCRYEARTILYFASFLLWPRQLVEEGGGVGAGDEVFAAGGGGYKDKALEIGCVDEKSAELLVVEPPPPAVVAAGTERPDEVHGALIGRCRLDFGYGNNFVAESEFNYQVGIGQNDAGGR